LAKDLGLSNKEMVDWLKSHDYDVKSHSSSLEDDQARAVAEKFQTEKAPKAAPPKPSSSGVVLRRKKADVLVPEAHDHAHDGHQPHAVQSPVEHHGAQADVPAEEPQAEPLAVAAEAVDQVAAEEPQQITAQDGSAAAAEGE